MIENKGMKYIPGGKYIKSWGCKQLEKYVDIPDKILMEFDNIIKDDIREKKRVIIKYLEMSNGTQKHINLECYDIEWVEGIYQKYLLIPCEIFNNYFREKKLKRIIDGQI